MEKLLQALSEIINSASSGPLGTVVLIVIVLAIIAYLFFKDASTHTKSAIFIPLFLGAALLTNTLVDNRDSTELPPIQPLSPTPVPTPPLPIPVTIDVPVTTLGNVVDVTAKHIHTPGVDYLGTIQIDYQKTTDIKPVTIVIERVSGGQIWKSKEINNQHKQYSGAIKLDGVAGARIKVFRWAPGAFSIQGSGGGEALLTLPKTGNLRMAVIVKN